MKKSYKFLSLAFTAVLFASCSADFLDSDPKTTQTDANFFKTEADATSALTGCYDEYAYTVGCGGSGYGVWDLSEVMSDECFGGTGTGDARQAQMIDEFDQNEASTYLSYLNDNWIAYYKSIYRCNLLLAKLDQISWTSEKNRNEIEGETRFLRALNYFDMVRIWGPVPLITTPIEKSEANMPRTSVDSIYSQIEQDLLFACKNAALSGSKWSESWGKSNDGHATIYAAKGMLARVFLFYTGRYGKTTLPGGTTKDVVANQLKDCLTSGYSLITSDGTKFKAYARQWAGSSTYRTAKADTLSSLTTEYIGQANPEAVYTVKYSSTGNWNNINGFVNMVMCAMRTGLKWGNLETPYACTGWGCATVNPDFASDMKRNAGDVRYKASVIDCSDENITMDAQTSTQREYTGYFQKKYTYLGTSESKDIYALQNLNFQVNEYTDFVMLRYADILLMYSELTGDVSYLNQVRERAGLADLSSYSVDALRAERKYEFAFEGIRYWDLLRYDSSLAYASRAITFSCAASDNKVFDATTPIAKSIDGSNLVNCQGYFQIPQEQINLSNGVLTQNKGWGNNK